MRLRLFVRLGCHLCETATADLLAHQIAFERVNIAHNAQDTAQYGTLVPVLYDLINDKEWIYPFEAKDVLVYLAHN